MQFLADEISGLEKIFWDVIIVGTGMGGAVIGYALAKKGKRVLFLEKGMSHVSGGHSLKGNYAEYFYVKSDRLDKSFGEILKKSGRYADPIIDVSDPNKSFSFIPFIGCGTGGSTALYGMALERFFPADFLPRRYYPDAAESTLPEQWPISYDDLKPYYRDAESLFRVRGSRDPLKGEDEFEHYGTPPPLSPVSSELFDFFEKKGLHPYRLPLACEFVADCECCQSFLCDRDCKNDSARVCLKPAVEQYGAILVSECAVVRLEVEKNCVSRVVGVQRGKNVSLRGKIIVLAAGALETPRILLDSANAVFPYGLANESKMVGRNLMRHFIDLYAVLPRMRTTDSAKMKEIAVNDYYLWNGQKFGTIQSFGSLPSPIVMTEEMEAKYFRDKFRVAGLPFRMLKPVLRFFIQRFLRSRVILATILEDLPYNDNMVTLSDERDAFGRSSLSIVYNIRPYDRGRINAFRKIVEAILKPYPFTVLKQAENNERLAHACGTCRFGVNPRESVLDRNNRAHGILNLYIVDSSFFPSSGGTNPALTIAANALRVADIIGAGEP